MVKMITNPGQAFTGGATWGTPSIDNAMSTNVISLINGTGLELYEGDIVCIDVTGTKAVLSSAAGDPSTIGVVGGRQWLGYSSSATPPSAAPGTAVGGFYPPVLGASRIDSVTTQTSATTLDSSCVATDLGRTVTGAGFPVGTYIISVTAGTSFVTNNATTASATVNATIQDSPGSIGPGYAPSSSFAANNEVPIITSGFGPININGLSALTAKEYISVASASVVGVITAKASYPATGLLQIGVSLQAYAARDVTLTTAGITGHDWVLALIGRC